MQISSKTRDLKITQVIAEQDDRKATQVVRISRNQTQVCSKSPSSESCSELFTTSYSDQEDSEFKKVKNGDAQC